VNRIAEGDFDGLKRDGIDPYPEADLGLWIRQYGPSGATVVPLPPEAWTSSEAIAIDGQPGVWAIVVDIWTTDESPSDLTLEATVTESAEGISVTVDNLHVM
jgi:hypothetical protein